LEIFSRPGFASILKNTTWLFVDRFIRALLGLLVGAWVARYLGPNDFGKLTYYVALIAIFQTICNLGLDGVVVREIAKSSKTNNIILGTVFWMKLLMGCFCWLVVMIGYLFLNGLDKENILILGLVGTSMVFQSADVIDLWFQGNSQNKRGVYSKLLAYLFSNAIKVFLILFGANLIEFALVIALEAALVVIALYISYSYYPCEKNWIWNCALGKQLVLESWPYMISGLSIMIYMRVDQLMIKEILGNYELGLFSIILPISNIWNMIPVVICSILAPYFARIYIESEEKFDKYLSYLFRVFWGISIIVIVFTIFFSEFIVNNIYGVLYKPSIQILEIYIFTNIPVFLGVGQNLWILNKGKSYYVLIQTFTGALVSIILNLILLPTLGIKGAAIAAVISYSVSAILINLLISNKLFLLQFGYKPRALVR
jgi:PST family polysaccharide transporter